MLSVRENTPASHAKQGWEEFTDKIIEKTGPTNLSHCSKNEDSFTLAIDAYSKIKNTIDLSNINNLIFVSETNIYQFPGNSFIFASKTELKEDIFLYDINAGCSGFVDALILAEKLDNYNNVQQETV